MNQIADYIPIACHIDNDTLLTKNGSLVQVIKITGFEENDPLFQTIDMRQVVREALASILDNLEISVYLNIIRERRDMRPKSDFPLDGFCKALDDAWCKKNNWDKQLVNTLYISLITAPIKTNTINFNKLIPGLLYKNFFAKCDVKLQELKAKSQLILEKLSRFGASKLQITKHGEKIISQPAAFYYNLISLVEKTIPLQKQDLSKQIGDINVKYHFNTIELTDTLGKKQFAAIYTLKNYTELPVEVYDKFLQLGQQFIITECFYPVPAKTALQEYTEIKEAVDISADKMVANASGLSRIFNAKQDGVADYCAHQISIIVHSDDINFFNDKVTKTVKALQEIGIAIVREDYNMAKVFWSQLPGNLRYMTRTSYIDSAALAGFTSIHHRKIGKYIGSKWGAPITMFRNKDGNPYYFTFHEQETGHTLIVGAPEVGKSTLARFFITQAMRLKPRLIYLDLEGKAETFMDALGGTCCTIPHDDESPLKINPFSFEVFDNNLQAAQNWLHQAIIPEDLPVGQYTEFFKLLTEAIFSAEKKDDERLASLKMLIEASADEKLINGFQQLLGSKVFDNLFAKDELDLFECDRLIAFDLSKVREKPNLLELFLPLMLQKIRKQLDGKPTIILINNANYFYNSPIIGFRINEWLEYLTKNNAMAVTLLQHSDNMPYNRFIQGSLQYYATKIFFADKFATQDFRKLYLLQEDELRIIKSYEKERRIFLMKKSGENIIGAIDLTGLPTQILSSLL